jgi:membrane protein YfhO
MKKRRGDLLAVFALVVLTATLALPFVSGERVLFPFHPGSLEPWRGHAPESVLEQPRNLVMSDKHAIIHPDAVFTRQQFEAGRVPQWNPHHFAGLPHQANPLTAVFYPPNAIFARLAPRQSYGFALALHAALAALFTFAFLRNLRVGVAASAFGGLAFAFGGWMAVHVQHNYFVHTIVWLPLALLCVERILRDRPRWALMGLALALGMMFLAGFPQTAVLNCYLILAYALVALTRRARIVWRREGVDGALDDTLRRGGALLVFALLGLALAAVQLGPTLDFKSRVGHQDLSIERMRADSLRPLSLLHLVSPDIFGNPADEHLTDVIEILLLGDAGGSVANNYSERSFYPGLLVLLLALIAPLLRRDRTVLTFFAGAALSIWFACGGPGLGYLIKLPGLNFGSPMRMTQIAAFAFPVLAAISLDALLKGAERHRPRLVSGLLWIGGVLLLPLAVVVVAAWMAPSWLNVHWTDFLLDQGIDERFGLQEATRQNLEARASGPFDQLRFALTCTLLFGLGALTFFLARGWRRTGPRIALVIAFSITLAELGLYGVRFNPPIDATALYEVESPAVSALRRQQNGGRFLRFGAGTGPWFMSPNGPLVWGLNDLQGFRAMTPQSFLEFMRTVEDNPVDFALPSLRRLESLDAPQLDLLRVRHVVSPRPIADTTWRQIHPAPGESDNAYVYENPRPLPARVSLLHEVTVLPPQGVLAELERLRLENDHDTLRRRVYLNELQPGMSSIYPEPSGTETVVLAEDLPGRLRIEVAAESGGMLLISEQFDPGWRALQTPLDADPGDDKATRLDSKRLPILRANHTLMAIPISPGRHRIELRYEPDAFRWGGLVSGLVLIFLLLVPILPVLAVRRAWPLEAGEEALPREEEI